MVRRLAAGLALAALLAACRRAEPPAPSTGPAVIDETPPAPAAEDANRDVTFRASGVEPGWLVEVIGGDHPVSLVLLWDYASNRLESREVTRADSGTVITFDATDGRTRATVQAERAPCTLPGSGDTATYTVTVLVGAQTLRGCGDDR